MVFGWKYCKWGGSSAGKGPRCRRGPRGRSSAWHWGGREDRALWWGAPHPPQAAVRFFDYNSLSRGKVCCLYPAAEHVKLCFTEPISLTFASSIMFSTVKHFLSYRAVGEFDLPIPSNDSEGVDSTRDCCLFQVQGR